MTWRDFILALLAAVIVEAFFGVAERLSLLIIRLNARRAPPSLAERLEEEWISDFDHTRGKLKRFWFAFDTFRATYLISHNFYTPQARVWEPLVLRITDIVCALVLLVFYVPMFVCTIMAIKIDGGWREPVFIVSRRVGRGGRSFWMLSFWTIPDRPIGRAISRLGIDTLPSIVNVLLGDMSFVGPRARRPDQNGEAPAVRPGLAYPTDAERAMTVRGYLGALLKALRPFSARSEAAESG